LGPSCGKKEKKKYREKELSQPVIPSLNIIDIHEYSSIPLMDLCHRYELRLINSLSIPDYVVCTDKPFHSLQSQTSLLILRVQVGAQSGSKEDGKGTIPFSNETGESTVCLQQFSPVVSR
jgi:hypothetical protein